MWPGPRALRGGGAHLIAVPTCSVPGPPAALPTPPHLLAGPSQAAGAGAWWGPFYDEGTGPLVGPTLPPHRLQRPASQLDDFGVRFQRMNLGRTQTLGPQRVHNIPLIRLPEPG